MRDLLPRLKRRCTSVEHLSLRSAGQLDSTDLFWSEALDIERYKQWAAFIDSVRGSLQTLDIEQSEATQSGCVRCCRPGTRPQPWRELHEMDSRFLKYIVPVLLLDKPWPKIRELTIRGVSGDKTPEGHQSVVDAVDRLRSSLGPQVVFRFDPTAGRKFYFRGKGSVPYYE